MKITLCGSIAFIDEMDAIRKELELTEFEVKLPPLEIADGSGKMIPVKEYYAIRKSAADDDEWVWKKKAEAIRNHFDKVVWADAVLVCNYDRNGTVGYIGANTLLEMGLAFHLKKPIYLLHPIPEVSYKEEILGMWPIVINGDLSRIS
jgi:hypothetical protein